MAVDLVIDSHLHCGIQNVNWPWEIVHRRLVEAGIKGAGLIPPVEDIYDRTDFHFVDTPQWQACRRQAHYYLLTLADPEITIYPYFFVWNDFAWEELHPVYAAVKWHRHPDEPQYHYEDPRCLEFIQKVTALRLPILLEEEPQPTLRLIRELAPGATFIIPHLGALNGGFELLARAGLWELPRVYADTALASPQTIKTYLDRYGWERLLFGSDFPFGQPRRELEKVLRLGLPEAALQAILSGNWLKLMAQRQTGTA